MGDRGKRSIACRFQTAAASSLRGLLRAHGRRVRLQRAASPSEHFLAALRQLWTRQHGGCKREQLQGRGKQSSVDHLSAVRAPSCCLRPCLEAAPGPRAVGSLFLRQRNHRPHLDTKFRAVGPLCVARASSLVRASPWTRSGEEVPQKNQPIFKKEDILFWS